MPDNLTTWQAESVGVTPDTKVGAGYVQFQTQKDLMVVAQKPRFVIPGDTLSLAAQVFNQSGKTQDVAVSFSSDTLQFLDKDTSKKVTSKSGSKAFLEGLKYLKTQKLILRIMLIVSSSTFLGMSLVTLFPAWAVKISCLILLFV